MSDTAQSFPTRVDISLTVNGEPVDARVDVSRHLVDFLRLDLGLTGAHAGCEHGVCGACTLQVDGEIVRGCLMLAAQLDGAEVWTVEGLTETGALADLQAAFVERNALQCGFCTPGFLMTVSEILETEELCSDEEIRDALSGNLCRCTGYEHIVRAVRELVNERDGVTA